MSRRAYAAATYDRSRSRSSSRDRDYNLDFIHRREANNMAISRPSRERDYEEVEIVRRREPERAIARPSRERDYEEVEIVRRREADPPPPPRSVRGGHREDIDIDIDITHRHEPETRSNRVRQQEYDELEIRRRQSEPQLKQARPRERDYHEHELDISYRREHTPERPRRVTREHDYEQVEFVRRRERSPEPPRRPPPPREREEEIDIRLRRERTPEPPRRPPPREREQDELEVRLRRERTPERRRAPVKEREYEEIEISRRREQPEFLREDYGKTDAGAMVIREREREIETYAPRRRSPTPPPPPPQPTVIREEKTIVREPTIIHEPTKIIREPTIIHEPTTIIREQQIIREPTIHQEIVTHHRHIDHGIERIKPPSPPPAPRVAKEEIDIEIERRTRDGGRRGEEEKIDIEIERKMRGGRGGRRAVEEELDIEIDRRKSRGGRMVEEEIDIEIDRRKSRGGRAVEEEIDIEIERRRGNDRRHRSVGDVARVGVSARGGFDDEIAAEAAYYNRRAEERGYIGEAYNGATRDWTIVDVPPGTERVRMDGVGGASAEVTWQRYNGVRRSKFIPERSDTTDVEIYDRREERPPRRYVAERDRFSDMWTEITKDLVVREAIEAMGYEFDETEFFFYVMDYLRYEDVLQLVELSQDIRRDRHERIREIQWEREHLPERPARRPAIEEERVVEREVIYEGRRPPPRFLRGP